MFAAFNIGNLKFSFDFSQFFPEGDDDLVFYEQFIKEFGTDDNFLLVAIEPQGDVFDQEFINRFHTFSSATKNLPNVTESASLTTLSYPLKTSFGYTPVPVFRKDEPSKYQRDWEKIQSDVLILNTLIDEKATSVVVALETVDNLNYEQSLDLLNALRNLLDEQHFTNYHLLGRAFFFEAIVQMQKREVMLTTIASLLLITLMLYLIYRKVAIVLISLTSIGIAFILFMGFLALLGKELNALTALYPILILIVGTSDVIHIMDNYLKELSIGSRRVSAIKSTLSGVGLSTLLTSATTALGFSTLLFSKILAIMEFGMNAAIGVLLAYVTVVLFTSSLLLLTRREWLINKRAKPQKWAKPLLAVNNFTRRKPIPILVGSFLLVGLCLTGIFLIHTNYRLQDNLPKRSKIALDFKFFQQNYAGFRPLEIAILAQPESKVTDYAIAQDIQLLENKIKSYEVIRNVQSPILFYKLIHRANHLNKQEFFALPEEQDTFEDYKQEVKKLLRKQFGKFVNSEETVGRIRARILDVGNDSLDIIYKEIAQFANANTDNSRVQFRITGRSLMLDKNAVYVRNSLLTGLVVALLVVCLFLAALYKNIKLVLVCLIPNVLPLLFAGALLGFLGIPLEASISIVFAVVFGIAVDDTIHFLGKYKLCMKQGLDKEEALKKTFSETGRALVITTLILFFGFMVMLFSVHQPSVTTGVLISVTLLAALIFDLLLIPVLIRKML